MFPFFSIFVSTITSNSFFFYNFGNYIKNILVWLTKEAKRRLISQLLLNFPKLVTNIWDVSWFASSCLWAKSVDFFSYLTNKASSLPGNLIATIAFDFTGITVNFYILETQSASEDVAQITQKTSNLLERFSFAFTANAKRQAAACRKSKKIILF